MKVPFCLLLMAAAPFWEAKPAPEWSLDQVRTLLTDSPWAQLVDAGKNNPAPSVQIYLATAEPVILAEDRLRASKRLKDDDPSWQEYREYLTENAGKYLILAVRVLDAQSFMDNSEVKHMEGESYMRIGNRKYKPTGHFPPSSTDPFVRVVFPREALEGSRYLLFDLYVPGAGSPYRQVQFAVKDLLYRGRPSY